MRLAVFTKNRTNPAYGAARLGAERAAAMFNDEVLHFVPDRPDDPEEQSALIDRALALDTRPDAVLISPVHPTKVDAALRRIAAAGIPIVSFVSPVDAVPVVSHVSSDDHALGLAIAQHLVAHLLMRTDPGSPRRQRVLVMSGHVESFTSQERLRGFHDVTHGHPGIEIVGTLAGDYDFDTARQQMAQWLTAQAAPDACLAANDIMALGVIEALEACGQSATVVGVNAIPEAISAIAEGRLLATADFNAMRIAYLATECAARHLRGESIPRRIELPVQIVDRSNCAQWDLPYAQRSVITLAQLLNEGTA